MFYMIKINGVLLSDKVYPSLRDAMDACHILKKQYCSVTLDIIRIDK